MSRKKLLLQVKNIEFHYGDQQIIANPFSIDIFSEDRIGVVGRNGEGKTTLLRLLAGELKPCRGKILRYCEIVFFNQISAQSTLNDERSNFSKIYAELCPFIFKEYKELSEGQKTRFRLATALANDSEIFFFDEPTTNLDISGKTLLLQKLKSLQTYLLVCHDRSVLETCCNKILEVDTGTVHCFDGNYTRFLEEKKRFWIKQNKDYEAYINEKKRLEIIYYQQLRQAAKIKKKPSDRGQQTAGRRMGGRSEDTQQKSLQRAAKATTKRLERLDVVEKPHEHSVLALDFCRNNFPANKFVIRVEGLTFGYGEKLVFQDASILIKNGAHYAFLGENGVGKSTLFHLITEGHSSISLAPKARIGYVSQTLTTIDFQKTVYENATENSIYPTTFVRTILNRMLFSKGDLDKIGYVLSGGEQIRLALAKLVLSNVNVLILDEITNYLDIPSIESVESLLSAYPGTILLASHDAEFVKKTATDYVRIQDRKLVYCYDEQGRKS